MYSKAAEADKNRLREAASRKRRQKEQLSSDRGKKPRIALGADNQFTTGLFCHCLYLSGGRDTSGDFFCCFKCGKFGLSILVLAGKLPAP